MGIFAKLKQLMNLDSSIKVKSQESLALDSKIKELSYNLELLKQKVQEEHIALENAVNNRESELAETRKQQEQIIDSYKMQLEEAKKPYDDFMEQFNKLKDNCDKAEKRKTSLNTILKVYRKLIKTINSELLLGKQIQPDTYKELERLTPEVELHLHSHDIKQLRSELSENDKFINNILERYEKRYTTKTNRALYQLMVIALQAEMQNILIHLRYNRLQDCKDRLTGMIDKYPAIVKDGNQTIAPTINSFIQEMGTLFEAKIDIEFEYYAKKEQEKQEQLALKEQMRQEAEERRALEIEEKKVQKEEEKYKSEIANIEKQVAECNDSAKLSQLQNRIGELMEQLSKLEEKKEEIIKRQNGKTAKPDMFMLSVTWDLSEIQLSKLA